MLNRSRTVAILDLGTNTFNLLVAQITDQRRSRTLFAEEFPVKLGEGGIQKNHITEAAFSRGMNTLREIKRIMQSYDVEQVIAVATSALRTADNSAEFIRAVYAEMGITIELINGDREADLIYKGVREAIDLTDTALIMDIGGGSVELIICDSHTIYWKKSYPIGAARLKERFNQMDPLSANDLKALNDYLNQYLADFFTELQIHHPKKLIGSAGAFETFAEMITRKQGKSSPHGSFYDFNMEEFDQIAKQILFSAKAEREKMPGLVAFRVDMIVMATVLTNFMLKETGIKTMMLSGFALKEGILAELERE